jgi:hypothetical protein
MMSWIKSQASGSGFGTENLERKKIEPGAAFSLFENHWAQIVDVMQSSEVSHSV